MTAITSAPSTADVALASNIGDELAIAARVLRTVATNTSMKDVLRALRGVEPRGYPSAPPDTPAKESEDALSITDAIIQQEECIGRLSSIQLRYGSTTELRFVDGYREAKLMASHELGRLHGLRRLGHTNVPGEWTPAGQLDENAIATEWRRRGGRW